MHVAVDHATSVFGGSNPSRRTRCKRLHSRELFTSGAGIRKPERDGARRGRVNFQQKMMRDRIPLGAQDTLDPCCCARASAVPTFGPLAYVEGEIPFAVGSRPFFEINTHRAAF